MMDSNRERGWLKVSLLSFCLLAAVGVLLRSKFVFNLPGIDYVRLLEAHSHFAFSGWVTFSLLYFVFFCLLKLDDQDQRAVAFLLKLLWICAIGMLICFQSAPLLQLSKLFSFGFILLTYYLSWKGWKWTARSDLPIPIQLLLRTALACLVVSSVGPLLMGYLFSVQSTNALLYKNALFTYLHLQYNGFFSLTILSLAFQAVWSKLTAVQAQSIGRFVAVICASIVPTAFLTYQTMAHPLWLTIIAAVGSLLLLGCLVLAIGVFSKKNGILQHFSKAFRWLFQIAFASFVLKNALQVLSFFKVVSDPVFGNRAIVMGFSHLVFLAFVSLFILGFYGEFWGYGWRKNGKLKTAPLLGLILVGGGIIANELLLGCQGFMNFRGMGAASLPWMLWSCSILVFLGAGTLFCSQIFEPKVKNENNF